MEATTDALGALGGHIPGARIEDVEIPRLTTYVQTTVPGGPQRALVADVTGGVELALCDLGSNRFLGFVWLPQSAGPLPRILCDPRSGQMARTFQLDEDATEDNKVTELESTAFGKRYKLRVHALADQIALRRVFEPSLIDWMTTDAPDGLGFQLERGLLIAYSQQPLTDTVALRGFWDFAAGLVKRVHEGVSAVAGRATAASMAPWIPKEFEERLDLVEFPGPCTTPDAVRAYMQHVGRLSLPSLPHAMRVFVSMLVLMTTAGVAPVVLFTGGLGSTAIFTFVSVVGVALYVARIVYTRNGGSRAIMLGQYAFAREYAKSRALELESGDGFAARQPLAKLEGRVQTAMRGTLPGGLPGTIALCADSKTVDGAEWEAVIVDLPQELEAVTPPLVPPASAVVTHDGLLIVRSPNARSLARTPELLDAIALSAAQTLDSMRRP